MSKKTESNEPEMREEYDFSEGVRGKYAARFAEGSNVIVLDPDVAEVFRDPQAVNRSAFSQGIAAVTEDLIGTLRWCAGGPRSRIPIR
jgi:hypothetical protein